MKARILSGLKAAQSGTALLFEKGAEAMNLAAGIVRGDKKLKFSLTIEGKEEIQNEHSQSIG